MLEAVAQGDPKAAEELLPLANGQVIGAPGTDADGSAGKCL